MFVTKTPILSLRAPSVTRKVVSKLFLGSETTRKLLFVSLILVDVKKVGICPCIFKSICVAGPISFQPATTWVDVRKVGIGPCISKSKGVAIDIEYPVVS